MPSNVTIQFSVRSLGVILGVAAALWLVAMFGDLLLILFIAMLLAIAIDPIVDRMERYGVPRSLAIVLLYVVIIAVVLLVIGLLIPILLGEFTQLALTLPVATQELPQLFDSLIAEHFPSLARRLSASDLGTQLTGEIGIVTGSIAAILLGIGQTLTTITVRVLLVLVVAFFLATDNIFASRVITRFFPPRTRATASSLARSIGRRLGHWARAQALVAMFFGTSFGVGLAILDVPYALSLGVVGGMLDFIPYIGGAMVAALAVLVALTISPLLALSVLVLYLVIVAIEGNIVYPKLVGNIVGLHPLVIVIALFIGAEARGVLGALLAVPITVVAHVLFDHFYRFEQEAPATIEPTHEPEETPAVAIQQAPPP